MLIKWSVFILFIIKSECQKNVMLISKTRSSFLENYEMYMDAVILRFLVPMDTPFVSFKIVGDEMELSIFGCKPNDIQLFMRHGAPPVINPDGSVFPKHFSLDNSEMYQLQFKSDKKPQYINITSPAPGSYYAAVFKPYRDPQHVGITQEGLTPQCFTFVEVFLYSEEIDSVSLVTQNQDYEVFSTNTSNVVKFYLPESIDHVTLTISNVNVGYIKILVQADNPPTSENASHVIDITNKEESFHQIWMQESTWNYIKFVFPKTETSAFNFKLKYYSVNQIFNPPIPFSNSSKNNSELFHNALMKTFRRDSLTNVIPYKQYNLIRDANTESFLFSFDLQAEIDAMVPLSINLTSTDFTVLKFKLREASDIGGTLQFIIAFKPRITKTTFGRNYVKEPENHIVVVCLRNGVHELPSWPNKCIHNKKTSLAPIVLNNTKINSTVYIPYPKMGTWFASLRLFCDDCVPCDCSDKCKTEFKKCVTKCEQLCIDDVECNGCYDVCDQTVIKRKDCSGCNCDGPCQRTDKICNTSLIFDLSSYPCINGKCAPNGKCMFMISQGIAYSTCFCMNNYRGWDCSDNTNANSYGMIVLELVLLVVSNIVFLPSAYFAYKREYYVESIVYSSTCFFSTFYHACDAGENIISFCIVKLSVLQFSDFFSALLSIWVTLIAMAYLPSFWPSICHISGVIVIAFGTTVNKQSLWVFMIPVVAGLIIIGINWYKKYHATGRLFPSKKYLTFYMPLGLLTVSVGLLMYSVLQTQSNYKYLHSLWHILMAVAVILLLPDLKTFLPEQLI